MKKQNDYGIDPRDPNRDLWVWLLKGNSQRNPKCLKKRSEWRRQQDRSTVSESKIETARRERETWATDLELLTEEGPET